MAFLDNSGDIILDAVLTETGRRRMAEGNFKITKFALGDDEIDYTLYNKNHASGSAYYDLEILQSPVFEAFTQINAGINYGLLPTTATDLLYLPVMKTNRLKRVTAETNAIATSGSSNLFVVTDSGGDSATSIGAVLADTASVDYVAGDGSGNNYVLLETGLDTGVSQTPNGTAANRQSYLVANGLIDRRLIVFYDGRFISGIRGIAAGSSANAGGEYNNLATGNGLNATLSLTDASRTNIQSGLSNYVAGTVRTVTNGVIQPTTGTNTETNFSVINGPRGIVAAISPKIKNGLDAEYTLYGGTTTVSGQSCKFIDTTIYVQGTVSSAQVQIPIRILRLS